MPDTKTWSSGPETAGGKPFVLHAKNQPWDCEKDPGRLFASGRSERVSQYETEAAVLFANCSQAASGPSGGVLRSESSRGSSKGSAADPPTRSSEYGKESNLLVCFFAGA
mmetsp:Transcript_102547/g.235267  ORF Transcript_102547/g.235267 Transcript_102547/m.235267 type:complete len:110 (-) Transcript_102547:260-589(-)